MAPMINESHLILRGNILCNKPMIIASPPLATMVNGINKKPPKVKSAKPPAIAPIRAPHHGPSITAPNIIKASPKLRYPPPAY